jgi:hypothetical protein
MPVINVTASTNNLKWINILKKFNWIWNKIINDNKKVNYSILQHNVLCIASKSGTAEIYIGEILSHWVKIQYMFEPENIMFGSNMHNQLTD